MTPRPDVLVLGVGNELLTDEGLGVEAARRLAGLELAGVEVLDGATLGLGLLPEIADRQCLLLLDAMVADDARPGDVLTLLGDDVPHTRSLLLSVHEIGVADALAAAELAGRAPGQIAAVGMVPESLATGYGLTPLVQAHLPGVLAAALDVLRSWGVGPVDGSGSGSDADSDSEELAGLTAAANHA